MTKNNPNPCHFWPQQSPINLFHDKTFRVDVPNDYLVIEYQHAPYLGRFVQDNGHWNWALDCERLGKKTPPTVELGGVLAQLVKIHVHMPSEHDLAGSDQDGEIHLIHRIVDPIAGSKLIVLGVFFAASADASTCVPGDFCAAWAEERASAEVQEDVSIDPRLLLPDQSRWYRYEGSLTSHDHDEVVSWLVFATPLGIDSSDLQVLKEGAAQPERATQELGRRFVLRNFP